MPTGNLPAAGKRIYEKAYQTSLKGTCKSREDEKACASKIAWTAVKNAGWYKDSSGNWRKRAVFQEFSLRIERTNYDKATNQMRWRAVASDVDEDNYRDNMSLGLFSDFIKRMDSGEQPPEEYCSEYWCGGIPYLSVSHYPDLDGFAVPGDVDNVYIDGTYLKAKGLFSDTPLGRRAFEAINTDLYNPEKSSFDEKVRISIAFLDWKHKHKRDGSIFERSSPDDVCIECILELITGEGEGKEFLEGHLIHLALTRVPVNERTLMEVDRSMTTQLDDAKSIIGDELAEEIEEKYDEVINKSMLVIKSESEDLPSEPVVEEGETLESEEMPPTEEVVPEVLTDDTGLEDKINSLEEMVRSMIEKFDGLESPPEEDVVESDHPLDGVLAEFRSAYDEIPEGDPDQRLRQLQPAYEELANGVINIVRGVQPEQPAQQGNYTELVSALKEAFAPVAQKVDMLIAQNQDAQKVGDPPRRSIDPNIFKSQFPQQPQQQPVKKSYSVSEVVEQTT